MRLPKCMKTQHANEGGDPENNNFTATKQQHSGLGIVEAYHFILYNVIIKSLPPLPLKRAIQSVSAAFRPDTTNSEITYSTAWKYIIYNNR